MPYGQFYALAIFVMYGPKVSDSQLPLSLMASKATIEGGRMAGRSL